MRLDASVGWLEGVRRVPSPNCDDRPAGCSIDLIVLHSISLPPGEFGGSHIDALFTNCLEPGAHPYFESLCRLQISAHVLIRRDGEVTQYVPFSRRAWHAGESHFGGRSRCNDFSIGIELEGSDWVPYEPVQYQQVAAISRLLMATWPGIAAQRIVGHRDVAPGRKTDPGLLFDWPRFYALLATP